MKVKKLKDIDKVEVQMEGAQLVSKQIPISQADGTPNYSLRVFTMQPNGFTPYHQHPYEHVNYIIDGEGELVKEDGSVLKLGKGDFALVMPNEKHQYRNSSKERDFIMICGVPKEFE